ncbi:MAG: DUF2147 domain-containing protein [Pseudomonadota bacterium]
MKHIYVIGAVLAATLVAAPLPLAANPAGLWQTEPDRKGQIAHVRSARCGASYCGTIVKVFDTSGQSVAAPTVGQRVFWDMTGSGAEYEGRAYVPAHNRKYDARMQVRGNSMKVFGCLGPICQSQTWRRVP